jgi:alginate O-acetyltransferase complex protein AlgI
MAFSELSFLFFLFPLALALHTAAPKGLRQPILLAVSLVFFAWGSPEYVLLLVLLIVFNYLTALQLQEQKHEKDRKRTLISAVAADLALLGFFKYWGFLLGNVNALLGTDFSVPHSSMPIGVSFFTFSILSCLFDVYRSRAKVRSFLSFALYVCFFPKLVSGPIVQYAEFESQLRARKKPEVRWGRACRLFLMGLAKKVLLSNTLGTTFYALSGQGSVSTLGAWLGAISYSLMLYFDFSGYSDMAIALAELFGFRFDKNFDYPYLSAGVSEFWRRWHISLGAWFRDYVYIPLGGSRVGTLKNIRNLFVVWALTGIWHGANWTFIFWGLYYGVLLTMEKYLLKDALEKLPLVLRRMSTLLLVVIGWVFFFSTDIGSAFTWLGAMFGATEAGFVDGFALYHLASGWLPLVIAVFAACPLGARIGGRITRMGTIGTALSVAWYVLLLCLCIAGMMSSTYSTFLYFQF